MTSAPQTKMSVAEYLTFERSSSERHEYADGAIFAMSGASFTHNQIVGNLIFELRRALGNGSCVPLASDMRVRAAAARYVYPDIVVVCGAPELEQGDTLLNPTLIVEVLSTSTEAYDRGVKFAWYRDIPSLREYLLVSQHERRVEQFVRQADARWLLSEATAGELTLPSINAAVPVAALYHGVEPSASR